MAEKKCELCRGTGLEFPEFYDEPCDSCDNNGWVEDTEDGGTMTCDLCCGESALSCRECLGEGVLDDLLTPLPANK